MPVSLFQPEFGVSVPEDTNFALFNQQRTEVALKVGLFVSDRSIGTLVTVIHVILTVYIYNR